MPDVLNRRQLNRATLDRQYLLQRVEKQPFDVVEHLVGMQAQNPRDPYIALWSRVQDFQPEDLEGLLLDRKVVRLVVQRGTVHLVTAADCLVLRPLAQPILTQQLYTHTSYKRSFDDVDLNAVMDHASVVLAEQPRNAKQLRAALADRFPDHDPAALAFACRNLLAFIQVPPRGLWSRRGEVVGTTAESWLGQPLVHSPSVDEVMIRYLAAFGPATVQDASTWSRYTGLREVFERLRPQLRSFHTESGRELFDVPDGTMPDADLPAPVRFLPEYDNVLLSHADRSRFVSDGVRTRMPYEQIGFVGSVLVDGVLTGCWRLADHPGTLRVYTVDRLDPASRDDVESEALQLLQLLAPGVDHDVEFEVVG